MSGGTFRTHSGLRAVINAWLEDISFRTGMITGAVVLLVIAAVGAAVAVLGHSGQAASALGSRGHREFRDGRRPVRGRCRAAARDARFRDACPVRSGHSGAGAVRGGRRARHRVTASGAGDRIGVRGGRGDARCQPGELPAGQSRWLAARVPARLG